MKTEAQIRRLNAKVPECMGASEVSAELGVKQNNLNKVANLPEHIPWSDDLSRGRLWRVDVIMEFAAERREKYGLEEPARA